MAIEIHQFWSLLSASKLASPAKLQSVFSEYSADPKAPRDVNGLAGWLVGRGHLSRYQAEILTRGHAGPFAYGPYRVVERITEGPLQDCFLARHRSTGTPVVLDFLPGQQPEDLDRWKRVEEWVDRLSPCRGGYLTPVYENVVLPDYRWVVCGQPPGKSIRQLAPKSRLPWKHACAVVAQLALGLQVLHDRELVHGSISDAAAWIDTGGKSQLFPASGPVSRSAEPSDAWPVGYEAACLDCLAPEIDNRASLTPKAEIYSLGCLLVRLVSGRPFCHAETPAKKKAFHQSGAEPQLTKYELPEDLDTLIRSVLATDPDQRPSTAAELGRLLGLYSGKTESIESGIAPTPKQLALREALDQLLPVSTSPIAELPRIDLDLERSSETGTTEEASGEESGDAAPSRIELARQRAADRKKRKWVLPLTVAASCVAFSLVLVGLASLFSEPPSDTRTTRAGGGQSATSGGDGVAPANANRTRVQQGVAGSQVLVEGDEQLLWETPTLGPPIDAGYLPPVPELLLQVRGAELMGREEGQRLWKSLGPGLQSQAEGFLQASGLELKDFESLLISFHDPESDDPETAYVPFAVGRLAQPVAMERLLDFWNQPSRQTTENGNSYYQNNAGVAFYPIRAAAPNADAAGDPAEGEAASGADVIGFSWGPTRLMEASLKLPGGVPLAGSLQDLVSRTDRLRHLNFLYLRPSLFNDQGQAWMGESLSTLNRELSISLPDEIQSGLVSFHIDNGNYLEFKFDQIVDLSPPQLMSRMKSEVSRLRDRVLDAAAQVRPNPYWDRVRIRLGAMISGVTRNLRWGIEQREVIGNCWLPPMAAHNLIAAGELMATFSEGASAAPVSQSQVPQSLEALLATPRDLDIANPPDLNVLMAKLKQEIDGDYRSLPFDWDIRLLGSDLEKEGITKNQRPGALVFEQKSLSEILTAIMVSANPSKDITGPEDPECKLVWVVAEDPEQPGQSTIFITTRAAAAEKSYTLPAAFRGPDPE